MRILGFWAANVAAVLAASVFVDGVDYGSDLGTLLLAGAVFGLVNVTLKPLLRVLALPLVPLTLGLVLFLVNVLMLYVTSWLVAGFSIASFRDAALGAAVIWAVNVVLEGLAWRRGRGAGAASA